MHNIFIHSSAEVSEDSKIGQGTKIWVNAQVREKSVIGENCVIGKDTYIDINVRIGNRTKIQNGVSIFHGVELEDDVFIGPNAAFTNDCFPRAFSKSWAILPTKVKQGASVGANATVICGITIGRYAMIGAGSVVTKDVVPHALVAGNPARQIGWVCKCGHRLNSDYQCKSCGENYEGLTNA